VFPYFLVLAHSTEHIFNKFTEAHLSSCRLTGRWGRWWDNRNVRLDSRHSGCRSKNKLL